MEDTKEIPKPLEDLLEAIVEVVFNQKCCTRGQIENNEQALAVAVDKWRKYKEQSYNE